MVRKHYPYDVFLSHSSKDKDFVRFLDRILRKQGLRTFLDEKDIPWGGNIPAIIERAIDGSKNLILVLSPDSVGSEWVDMERCIAIFRTPSGQDRTILPLLRRNCDYIPGTVRILKHLSVRTDEEFEFVLPQILRTLKADYEINHTNVNKSILSHSEFFKNISTRFGIAIVEVHQINEEVTCIVYSPDGNPIKNTRPVSQTIHPIVSNLQPEISMLEYRYGDKDIYLRAGKLIRDAFFTPHMVKILETSAGIHFCLDYTFLDIAWELCAGTSYILGTQIPISRSLCDRTSRISHGDSLIPNNLASLRILMVDTTGNSILSPDRNGYRDSRYGYAEDTIKHIGQWITVDYQLKVTPTLYEFEHTLMDMKPNVVWIIGHQMNDGIPLKMTNTIEMTDWVSAWISAAQMADFLGYSDVGLLLFDCCKTGFSKMSSEDAFTNVFQELSNWSVIHPFGWTSMVNSEIFTRVLFENLAKCHNLPHSVFEARHTLMPNAGWWSNLLQGNLSAMYSFSLGERPKKRLCNSRA